MIPRFTLPHPRNWLGITCLFATMALVASCQNTTVIEEEEAFAPGKHYVHFRVSDTAAIPDSLWYRTPQDSGSERFTVHPMGSVAWIAFFPYIQQITSRDSMRIDCYRLGLHLGTYPAKLVTYMDLTTTRVHQNDADSLAVNLVRLYDSLRRANPTAYGTPDTSQEAQREALRASIAGFVFTGHPGTEGYRHTVPQGLDSAAMVRRILTLAVNSGLTLGEAANRWNLPLDYSASRRELARMEIDSTKTNPFRLSTPWELNPLHLGEPPVGLTGVLDGRKGIQALDFSIWTDSADQSGKFIFSDLPDLRSQPSHLDVSGRPAIAPRAGIGVGSYTLRIMATDSVGNRQSYQVPLLVGGPLDHQGPSIRWRSPQASQVREYADSLIAVRVEVTDTAGIAGVSIGDSAARDSSGIWCSTWVVPVSELGSPLRVRAKDKNGNQTDSILTLSRRSKPEPGAPSLELVRPTAGTWVPNEEDSTEIVWRGTLANGKVESVWIEDRPAHKGSEGLWSLKVSLPATGKPVVVPVRAQGSNGLESRSFCQIGRHRDTLGPAIVWDVPVQDAKYSYSTAITSVSLKATDPSGIDSARIGGSLAKKVGDTWKADVLLGSPGSTARIAVSVWDSAGNRTDSVIRLARADLPSDLVPEFRLVSPGRKAGVHVPWDSASVWIRWVVRDLSGIDSASVRINNQPALRENDSTWALRVPLAPLSRLYIPITATNRKGNAQAEVVEITRDGESSLPKVSRSLGLKDTVLFNDTAMELSWTISDNALESVRIAGTTIQGTTGGTYTRQVPLKPGLQWLHLEATDSSKNTTQDSIRVLSLPGMKRVENGKLTGILLTLSTGGKCVTSTDSLGTITNRTCTPIIPGTMTIFLRPINGYYMNSTHTTQREFQEIMSILPPQPRSISDLCPATNIHWADAIRFCNKKSLRHNLTPAYDISNPDSSKWRPIETSNGYRIPTGDQYFLATDEGDTLDIHSRQYSEADAWYNSNSDSTLHPVGSKNPNKFGFFDLHGNAFHWAETSDDTSGTLKFSPVGSSYLSRGQEISLKDDSRIFGKSISPEIGFRTILPLSAGERLRP